MNDYYDTLGVSKDYSQGDIKKAFRELALEHHPDRETGNSEKFKKISEAYDTLGDVEKRQQYDNPMPRGNFGGFQQAWFGNDVMDVFRMNQRAPGQPIPRNGADAEIRASISLLEALFGATFSAVVKFKSYCIDCSALGGSGWISCNSCGGSGASTVDRRSPDGRHFSRFTVMCKSCSGQAGKFSEICSICNGTRARPYEVPVEVEIPPGFSGGLFVLRGKGGPPILGGEPGSIALRLGVEVPNLKVKGLSEEEKESLKTLLDVESVL